MKILCSITFHGYGHLSQMAPVIYGLRRQRDDIAWTLQCAAPRALLQKWFAMPFDHVPIALDDGVAMHNAMQVDVAATYRRFAEQHAARDEQLARARAVLQQVQPDLVITDISHLLSRAAADLGIPCIHLCSLNWADTFFTYCRDFPDAELIYRQLCDDYSQAQCFYALTPGMPMTNIANVTPVGPVCRVGERVDLARHFQRPADTRFVFVCLGGMDYPIAFERWPQSEGCVYINGGAPADSGVINVADTGLDHLDILASCDVVVTKPGYGMFTEAACSGRPVLYLPRGDWPEEPWLVAWQRQHGFCQPISDAQLQQGDFAGSLQQALCSQPLQLASPTGVATIVEGILAGGRQGRG